MIKMEVRMDFINGKEKTTTSDFKIQARKSKKITGTEKSYPGAAEAGAGACRAELVTSSFLLCLYSVLYELSTRIAEWNICQF